MANLAQSIELIFNVFFQIKKPFYVSILDHNNEINYYSHFLPLNYFLRGFPRDVTLRRIYVQNNLFPSKNLLIRQFPFPGLEIKYTLVSDHV